MREFAKRNDRLPLPLWILCSPFAASFVDMVFFRLPLFVPSFAAHTSYTVPRVKRPFAARFVPSFAASTRPFAARFLRLPLTSFLRLLLCFFFFIACCFCLILFYVPVCRLCCFPFAASRIPVCRRLPLMLCSRLPLDSVPVCRFPDFRLTRLLTSYTGSTRHAAM